MAYLWLTVFLLGLSNAQVLNPPNCGERPLEVNKIVGGSIAAPGDWGWQVSLLNNMRHFCGGVLINPNWIVTAAHCFGTTQNPATISVDIGVHDRTVKESWVINRKVSKIILHQSYTANPPKNDITLIKLESPVSYDDLYYIPACLSDGTESYDSTKSITTGWGTAFVNGATSRYLMQVTLPVLTDTKCKSRYGGSYNSAVALCAGENGVNLGPCQGDSGGPLVVKSTSNGKWYLIGLTSWGIDCGNGGVYTRVSSFRTWIDQTIAAN